MRLMESVLHMFTTCTEYAQQRNRISGNSLPDDLNLVPLIRVPAQ
jgi:hypothetical protein